MDKESELYRREQARDLTDVVDLLRAGRDPILRDWMERVRDNTAIKTGSALSDPLLLDHLPQMFDAILDRLEINRPREDAEQFAAVHGFTRRISGYDILESVIELLVFRHAIWAHLVAVNAPMDGGFAAMERVDGMVDRAVISSLRAYLDPGAKMLVRRTAEHSTSEELTPPPEGSVPI
jgi:hypothetical protein